jgi:hypothetical protein
MSNPHTTKSHGLRPRQRTPRSFLFALCILLFCVFVGLVLAGWIGFARRANVTLGDGQFAESANAGKETVIAAKRPLAATTDELGNAIRLVNDDGKTLWVSPTDGPPIDLSFVPPGCQLFVALRMDDSFALEERIKVFQSLGPLGLDGLNRVEARVIGARRDWYDLPSMIVGLRLDRMSGWSMCRVVCLREPFTDSLTNEWLELFENNVVSYKSQRYGLSDDVGYFLSPPGDKVAIGPEALIKEIIDLDGNPPPLRRDMERLVVHTDADRHVTILFSPNWLFSDGQGMFSGQMAGLREPLFWFLGDEFSAAALSLHWDANFFIELIAVPTLDTSPERAARILADRLAEVPKKLEAYLATLEPQPYGREVLSRFPLMVRTMLKYTRSGFEADHAVLRCYLPAAAGHNLLMGAELTLAQSLGGGRMGAEAAQPSVRVATTTSVRERLRRATSLRFARDTLEAALEQLSQDIGVEIVIRGADLQAEGITKNQSFGIDVGNKPAKNILVEILRLANPDKSATGPNDPRQKLVYIIAAAGPDNGERVIVTTRAASAARGEVLPAVFRSDDP